MFITLSILQSLLLRLVSVNSSIKIDPVVSTPLEYLLHFWVLWLIVQLPRFRCPLFFVLISGKIHSWLLHFWGLLKYIYLKMSFCYFKIEQYHDWVYNAWVVLSFPCNVVAITPLFIIIPCRCAVWDVLCRWFAFSAWIPVNSFFYLMSQ